MSRVALFLVGLTLLICSHPSYAQEEAPGLLDVRIVTVKPNLIADWVELKHELNAAPRPLAGAQQILAVGGSLVELAEQTLLRRRHDLSPN